MRKILLGLLLLSITNQTAKAQLPDGTVLKLQNYLKIQQQRIGFNGVVFFAKGEKTLFRQAVGQASFELKAPLNTAAVFKIASISKSFTAMLVMIATEEHRLSLNDSLAKFFPQLNEPLWRKITVDQLLSQRSGLPHDEGLPDYWKFKYLLPLNREQALGEIFKMKLLFEPGTDAHYSSPGYFLLAVILENIYHESYAALLKEKITGPLAMTHTGVADSKAIIPGMVSGYHLLGDSLVVAPYRDHSLMKGSGDLYSDAGDQLKWTNSFARNKWSKALKAALFTAHSGKALHNEDLYGYGWFIRNATGNLKQAYYHGGGSFGCSALCAWYPEQNFSIIILSNVSALPVNELWNDLEKIVFQQPFQLPVVAAEFSMTPEQLKQFEGIYKSGGVPLQLELIDGHIYARLGANPQFAVYPESPLVFFGKKVNIRFTFEKNESGKPVRITTTGRGPALTFTRQ